MKNWKLRFKLFVPTLVLFATVLVLGLFTVQVSNHRENEYQSTADRSREVSRLVERIQVTYSNMTFHMFLYYSDFSSIHLSYARGFYSKLFSNLKDLTSTITDQKDRELLADFEESYRETDRVMTAIEQAVESNKPEVARGLFVQFLTLYDVNLAKIRDIRNLKYIYTERELKSFRDSYNFLTGLMRITIALAFLAVLFLIVFYELFFLRPLRNLNRMIQKLSQSDFNFEIPSVYQDELGDLNRALSSATLEVRKRIDAESALNEKLKSINAELQHFSYVMSHDLKEPLRTISIYSELLKRKWVDKLDEEAKLFIKEIVDGCARMQSMILGLLSLYEIDSNETASEVVPLDAAVATAISNLKGAIEAKNAVVECESLPSAKGNLPQFVELFQNLIGNAIKYNKSDIPKVKIARAAHLAHAPDQIVISVKDNGIGMEQKYSDQIFKIFSRLHNKETYPGTGIGLALCKKIVERHRGRIWMESKPGVGTTFFVLLKAA